jgi:translocation and assembly module TamB
MRYLKFLSYTLLSLGGVAIVLILFIFNTTPGFYLILKIANLKIPGNFELTNPEGSFLRNGIYKNFIYRNDGLVLQFNNATLSWDLRAFLHKELVIRQVSADDLIVTLSENKEESAPFSFPSLPVKISINEAKIKHFSFNNLGKLLELTDLHFAIRLSNQVWDLPYFNFQFNTLHAALNTKIAPFFPYQTKLDLKFNNIKNPPITGHLYMSGDLNLFQWQGDFSGVAIGTLKGKLSKGRTIHTEVFWNQTQAYLNTGMHRGQVTLNGQIDNLAFKGMGESLVPDKINWDTAGKYSGGNITVDTNVAIVNWQDTLKSHITSNVTGLNALFSMGNNTVSIQKNFSAIPWVIDARINEPALLHPVLQGLNTTILAKAKVESLQKASLEMKINPGYYQLPAEANTEAIHFEGGKINAFLDNKGLKSAGLLNIDPEKFIALKMSLPKIDITKFNPKSQVVMGEAKLQINSLSFLKLPANVENPQGKILVNLAVEGTLQAPQVEGEAILSQASLGIPKLSLLINPIDLKVTSRNKNWDIVGKMVSEEKTIQIEGKGVLAPELKGLVTIQGDSFPAMHTAEYNFSVSPNLQLVIDPKNTALNGEVVIPTASFKPVSFSDSVNLSSDVLFVSDEKTHAPLNMNVQVIMGSDVSLDIKGMHGYLDGSILLLQQGQADLVAQGELVVRDGKYEAYGQNLTIEKSQLMFTGPVDNPTINLRAVRKINNNASNFNGTNQLFDFNVQNLKTLNYATVNKVGIQVRGRVNAPKVTLFSVPGTLSQADILSFLLLGVPASQASKSGGQILMTAISSMNLDSGTKGLQLIEQLKNSLGVDFAVQNTSGVNKQNKQVQDGTAFVVTKSLSKRLQLAYNIGLDQNDNNLLTLKYLLNKFLSVQVSASYSGSGIDLLYTHQKD